MRLIFNAVARVRDVLVVDVAFYFTCHRADIFDGAENRGRAHNHSVMEKI